MWMLSFVPDTLISMVVNAVFWTGLVYTILGFVLRFKAFEAYRLFFQVAGVILLVLGVYFKGGYDVEQSWRLQVAELEAKVAAAEEKSKEANIKIETKVVERVKVVKQNVEVIKKEIQIQKEIINQDCSLNQAAIDMYNQAVINSQGTTR